MDGGVGPGDNEHDGESNQQGDPKDHRDAGHPAHMAICRSHCGGWTALPVDARSMIVYRERIEKYQACPRSLADLSYAAHSR